MSAQYDQYLTQHRSNVRRGYEWLCKLKGEILNET